MMQTHRVPAYFEGNLVGCAQFETKTGRYIGLQMLCKDCKKKKLCQHAKKEKGAAVQ
ncbi:MAG: hypothetical protein UY48_C0013G0032 [Candidatus Gottesmanbacteria bacterium GW2011_GWB1_49_7]|uniref:Uncharacterized protein n=1 Tax=Candidatus Gottesmanbacteria bacterium GW2011_GWB1_49_7 TaxID=1618448 RepID=A0A0G1VZ56_9BACT|nr:MAG: hypothetical protein UY48_C0013G0032 [Candidatus Gottesmanbacteria bacterium GW2011_GWB1_49_7]